MQQGESREPAASISLNYILHNYNYMHVKLSNIMIISNFPKTRTLTGEYLCVQLYKLKKNCLSNIWFVQNLVVFNLVLFIPFCTDPLQCHTARNLKRNISRDPVPLQNNNFYTFLSVSRTSPADYYFQKKDLQAMSISDTA